MARFVVQNDACVAMTLDYVLRNVLAILRSFSIGKTIRRSYVCDHLKEKGDLHFDLVNFCISAQILNLK